MPMAHVVTEHRNLTEQYYYKKGPFKMRLLIRDKEKPFYEEKKLSLS